MLTMYCMFCSYVRNTFHGYCVIAIAEKSSTLFECLLFGQKFGWLQDKNVLYINCFDIQTGIWGIVQWSSVNNQILYSLTINTCCGIIGCVRDYSRDRCCITLRRSHFFITNISIMFSITTDLLFRNTTVKCYHFQMTKITMVMKVCIS